MKKKHIIQYSKSQSFQYHTFIDNAKELIQVKDYNPNLFEEINNG